MATWNNSGIDVKGRSGYMLVPPLDKDDVIAALLHHVVDRVPFAALMFDHDFLARNFRAVHAHEEAVVSGFSAIDGEAVPAVDDGRFESGSAAGDPGCVGFKNRNDRSSRRSRHRNR